jgi:acetyl-CoA carboxylase biotin carboxyl carrier protein
VTLTAKDVEEITRLLEESSFDELYLELDGVKLSLRRAGAAANTQTAASVRGVEVPAQPSGSPETAPEHSQRRPAAGDPDSHDVPAPLLGTFYRAPKPGAPAFVEVGSLVEEETIIGIIEVMKLMNTVRAGVRGRVTEILARDGVLVEYGETLVRVGPSSA